MDVLFVINESNRESYRAIIPPEYFREPVLTPEELARDFERMEFSTYTLDGRIVGVAALETMDEEVGEAHWVYILPGYQGKGIGTALVEHLEAEARRKGLRRLRVPTANKATWAKEFYTRLGYELVDMLERPEGQVAVFGKEIGER